MMNRTTGSHSAAALLVMAGLVWSGCRAADGKTPPPGVQAQNRAATVAVAPAAATEQLVARFIRVTGSLTAEEQASVAAETAGRVVA
ncbi:MAG: hypothetical protein ABUS56_05255, partial [Acidobacteriota bacterium]